jgi:hypothetical protein
MMGWSCNRDMRKHTVFDGKPKENSALERSRYRWEDNTKMDRSETRV